jgi:hypothetical protein
MIYLNAGCSSRANFRSAMALKSPGMLPAFSSVTPLSLNRRPSFIARPNPIMIGGPDD